MTRTADRYRNHDDRLASIRAIQKMKREFEKKQQARAARKRADDKRGNHEQKTDTAG